jgi:hypothetical protein
MKDKKIISDLRRTILDMSNTQNLLTESNALKDKKIADLRHTLDMETELHQEELEELQHAIKYSIKS